MLGIMAAAAMAAAPAMTRQVYYTGNTLLAECTTAESSPDYVPARVMCKGYIIGVADGATSVCMPLTANIGQTQDIAIAWLKRHPEVRHLAAPALVTMALAEAFPCRP